MPSIHMALRNSYKSWRLQGLLSDGIYDLEKDRFDLENLK